MTEQITFVEEQSSVVVDGMRIDWDVPIEMDDGVVLRADVFRPVEEGQYPVIMTLGPYAKGLPFQVGYAGMWNVLEAKYPEIMRGSTCKYQNWETADPEKWVPDGYVCVRVDSRGAGRSPGYLDVYSPRENLDYYHCIEWAGTQPWSNGKVGLLGISYYGVNQWLVAQLQPPHLAAMCPFEGYQDFYRECNRHGGILNTFMPEWFPVQVMSVQYGNGLATASTRTRGSPSWPASRFPTRSLRRTAAICRDELRGRELDDDWYRDRSAELEKITVPLLSAANWDPLAPLARQLRGVPRGLVEREVARGSRARALDGVLHRLRRHAPEALLRALPEGRGHRLGRAAASLSQPARSRRLVVQRGEQEWPLARTQWTKLYIGADGESLLDEPGEEGSVYLRRAGKGCTFLADPLTEPTEIIGPCAAKLFVSSSTEGRGSLRRYPRARSGRGGRDLRERSGTRTGSSRRAGSARRTGRPIRRKEPPLPALAHPRREAAANAGRALRDRRRDLADLRARSRRLPRRGQHPRQGFLVGRRRAVATDLRDRHARRRDLPPQRRRRPARAYLRRPDDALYRRRRGFIPTVADHSGAR